MKTLMYIRCGVEVENEKEISVGRFSLLSIHLLYHSETRETGSQRREALLKT